MKRALLIIMISVLVLMAAGGTTAVVLLSQQPEVTDTVIEFTVDRIDILVGDTMDIPLTVTGDGEVNVISSNSDILSITEEGKLLAKSTLGNNISKVWLTASVEGNQDKIHLNEIYVYNDVNAYIDSLGDGLYVVYRVYNKQDDSWRIAGVSTRYQSGGYVNAPMVDPAPGYDMTGAWYSAPEMLASNKIVFQDKMIYNSYAVYAEEFLRDGSASVYGHIDLNIAFDTVSGVYVVTGLKYDYLKYESITIPETYTYTKDDGTTETVEIKGIADSAFERGVDLGNGKISNVGLQALQKVDISYIQYIGNRAFANCHALETVVFKTGTITIASTAFDGTAYKNGGNA